MDGPIGTLRDSLVIRRKDGGGWRIVVRCCGCEVVQVRDFRSVNEYRGALRAAGWGEFKRGWFCGTCRGHGVHRVRPLKQTRLGELLGLWRAADGRWKAAEFAAALGVTRQRVYRMRARLVARGVVPPGGPLVLAERLETRHG